MSKHTPEPWGFCRLNKRWGIYPESAVNDGIDYFIATTAVISNPEREKANARLIASAPDLLEALQAFVTWAEGAEHGWACPSEIETAIRAAIAKAKGSTTSTKDTTNA